MCSDRCENPTPGLWVATSVGSGCMGAPQVIAARHSPSCRLRVPSRSASISRPVANPGGAAGPGFSPAIPYRISAAIPIGFEAESALIVAHLVRIHSFP